MTTFLAAAVVFLIAFLGMAISVMRNKRCLGCSCKAAERIIRGTEKSDSHTCGGEELIQLEKRG